MLNKDIQRALPPLRVTQPHQDEDREKEILNPPIYQDLLQNEEYDIFQCSCLHHLRCESLEGKIDRRISTLSEVLRFVLSHNCVSWEDSQTRLYSFHCLHCSLCVTLVSSSIWLVQRGVKGQFDEDIKVIFTFKQKLHLQQESGSSGHKKSQMDFDFERIHLEGFQEMLTANISRQETNKGRLRSWNVCCHWQQDVSMLLRW